MAEVAIKITADGQAVVTAAQQATQALDGIGAQAGKAATALQESEKASAGLNAAMANMGVTSNAAAQSTEKRLVALRAEYDLLGKTRSEIERYMARAEGLPAQAQREAAAIGRKIDEYHRQEQVTRELAATQDRAYSSADRFIESLRRQAETAGMTRKELLSYQAAQLGVSGQAAPLISGLKDAETHMGGFGFQTAGAKRELLVLAHELSQGNYSRFGSSMMVLGEQTGAAGLLFSGAGLAILGVTAGLGLMGYAMVKGGMEQREFNNALIQTGGYAGVTGDGLNALAHEAVAAGGSLGEAKKVVTELAASGKYTGEQIGVITDAVIAMEHATGGTDKTTEKLIKQFESLAVQTGGGTLKSTHAISDATLKLDDQYHFLTESVFEQIRALEKEDGQKAASKLATEEFAKITKERAEEMSANLGSVARGWNAIKAAASGAMDAIGNVGKKSTAQSEVDRLTALLNERDGQRSGGYVLKDDPNAGPRGDHTARTRAVLALAAAQDALNNANDVALQKGEAAQAESKAIHAAALITSEDQRLQKKGVSELTQALEKYKQQVADIRAVNKDSPLVTDKAVQDHIDALTKAHTVRGANAATAQSRAMSAQIEAVKQGYKAIAAQTADGLDEIDSLRKQDLIGEYTAVQRRTALRLQDMDAQKQALQAELALARGKKDSGTEQARLAGQLTELEQKRIALQNRSARDLQELLVKPQLEQVAANYKTADSVKDLAEKQEAANAVFGKSKTAIELMSLATMKQQLLEAEGSDRFTPEYIKSLNAKITAQERYAKSLQGAEYTDLMRKEQDWLDQAKERASLYEDEAQLASLTNLQRAKIVATRQIELRLAKELAEIDKGNLSDAQKDVLRIKAREAAQIDSSAAVNKVVQEDWNKSADQISQSLTDAIMSGGQSGADYLKNLFRTLVLRPLISAVMSPVAGVVNSVVNSGMSAIGLGNGGSLASTASSLSSLVNIGSSIGSGITQTIANLLPSAISAGLGMTSTALAASNAALIGGGASATAAASAAAAAGNGAALGGMGASMSAALAAIPVWGWVALGTAAVGAALIGKGDSRFGSQYDYTAAAGTKIVGGPNAGVDFAGASANQNLTIVGINTLLAKLGSSATVAGFGSGFESSEKGKGFSYAGGTLSTGKTFGTVDMGYMNNRGSKNAEEALAEYKVELTQSTLQALQAATDIPKSISATLAGLDIGSMTGDALTALVGTLDKQISDVDALRAAMVSLPFASLKSLSFDAAAGLIAAADGFDAIAGNGLEALSAAMDTYYSNFYTDEEKRLQTIKNVNAATAGSGLDAATATRASYRALMDAQDVTTASGQAMYVKLLGASTAFASITTAVDAVAAAKTDLVDAYKAEATAMQSTVDKFRTFATDLRTFRDGLLTGTLSPLTPGQRYAQTSSQFDQLLAATRTGTTDERATAIGKLQGASTALLEASKAYNASGGTYLMDFARVQEALSGAAINASATADVAQLQLDAAKSQLTALGQIDKSVLTVSQAIIALASAQQAAGTAGALPSFAIGTNYVPHDMVAQIHQGEAIVPRAYNPAAGARMQPRDDGALVAEIKALREEVRQLRQQQSAETGDVIAATHTASAKNAQTITAQQSKAAWSKPPEMA